MANIRGEIMEIEVGLFLNALIILAIVGGVLGIGFKAVNSSNKKKD